MTPTDSAANHVVRLVADAAVRSCVVLMIITLIALSLRRASAAARHAVWALGLAAALAVPVMTGVLPRWVVAVRPGRSAAAERTAAAPDRPTPAAGRTAATPADEDRAGRADLPDDDVTAHAARPSEAAAVSAGRPAATAGRGTVYGWACAVWLSGVAGVGASWAVGIIAVWRIGRQATAVTHGPLHDLTDDVRRRLGVGRAVRLLVGNPGTMPATWGVRRPTLVLPDEAVGWPADRARAVLLHEMAHVRRRDCAVQHLASLATAVYWFNPLVWLAGRQLRLERERACDDVVVTHAAAPTAYAEQLVALARAFAGRGWAATATVEMARRSGLAGRVRSILSDNVNRTQLGRRSGTAAVLAVTAVLVPASALHLTTRSVARAAEPVAGQTSPPGTATAILPLPMPAAGAAPAAADRPVAATRYGITVDAAFDCGSPITARVGLADHVSVALDGPDQLDSWVFRLRGVAGRTMKVDVTLPAATVSGDSKYSKAITPVYGTAADLTDPAGYATGPIDAPSTPGRQGFPLPDTRGQAWHYLTDATWADHGKEGRVVTFTQAFTTDTVYIANRVPRPPGYNDWFLDGLAGNPLAKVVDLGRTPEGRRIRAVQIGDDAATGRAAKPCVLVAGGEQAHQPDGTWAAQGCAEFLLGDSAEAKAVRARTVFLVVPTLDPDGTAHPDQRFVRSFWVDSMYATSIAYADWLQGRELAGRRLDLVLELHSNQGGELEHGQQWLLGGVPAEESALRLTIDGAIARRFAGVGLTASRPHNATSLREPYRFGGWIDHHLGGLYMMYTVNAQAPSGHLSLAKLKDVGRLIALAADGVIGSRDGARLLALADGRRATHDAEWQGCPTTRPTQNAIESEQALVEGTYLRHVARTNVNAATRPVDFKARFRMPASRAEATNGSLSAYTRTAARAELLGRRVLAYAGEHGGRLPASLGVLTSGLDGQALHDLAQDCLTPGDEQRAGGVPEQPTADWIDRHTSYVYPAAGTDLTRLQGRRAAKTLAATAMFHTRFDQPFFRPADDEEEVIVVALDGQRQAIPVADATRLINKSTTTLRAAGANVP